VPGGEDRTIEFLKKEGGSGSDAPLLGRASEERYVNHPFPMNYMLNPWPIGEWFYIVVKSGLVQYVCPSTDPVPFDFAAFGFWHIIELIRSHFPWIYR
jgi:hypothetical protein